MQFRKSAVGCFMAVGTELIVLFKLMIVLPLALSGLGFHLLGLERPLEACWKKEGQRNMIAKTIQKRSYT